MPTDQIVFPSYVQSGMILQQKTAFKLRGQATAGITIDLVIERHPAAGEKKASQHKPYGQIHQDSTVCDGEGAFIFEIPPFMASFSSLSMTVRAVAAQNSEQKAYIRAPGKPRPLPDIVVIDDILIGEVWVSGGQDNMVLPLTAADKGDYRNLLDQNDLVRFFLQNENGKEDTAGYSYEEAKEISDGRWTRAGRIIDLRKISAVAAWFAYDLNRRLRVPVGIVSTEVAGSLIHNWIDRKTLLSSDECVKHIKRIGLYRDEESWETEGDHARYQPAVFYNHKIAPLRGLPCRGFLWYQGESDVAFPAYYREAIKLLLKSWQNVFTPVTGQTFNLIYTQLAPYYYASLRADALPKFNLMLAELRKDLPIPASLIAIQDLSLQYEQLPDDWKHPLHPQVKRPVGERMASTALGMVYQQKAPPTSPELNEVKQVGNKLMLTFHHTFSNLRLRGQETALRGFSIAGEDKKFYPAKARLLYGVQAMLWHPDLAKPLYAQYAMSELNTDANLISDDNMTVVPFTTVKEGPVMPENQQMLDLDQLTFWAYPPSKKKDPLPDQAAMLSYFRATKDAKVQYRIEMANHIEGEASVSVDYEADSPTLRVLWQDRRYPSLRPKLQLKDYKRLTIMAFNLDSRVKAIRLCGHGDWQNIEAKLSWQTLSFPIDDSLDDNEFYFELEDRKRAGKILFDQIVLWRNN